MRSASVLIALVSLAGIVWAAPPARYSDKFDNIDLDAILSNDRVLTNYINCVLDKGPCTPEGREFKKNLPEALATDCVKCTDGQKKMIRKASNHIIKNRKADWEQIRKKFDPKGQHHESFAKFLQAA